MALTNRIKIIFATVDVRRDTPRWGPCDWTFQATINGQVVGNPQTRFPATPRSEIALPEDQWSHIIDISTLDRIEINFAGTAIGESGTHNLGRVRWVMRWRSRDFGQQEHHLTNYFFILTVRVEVEVEGTFGTHAENEIYASRVVGSQTIWTMASGRRISPRLEFCEVRPIMGDWAMPPRPNQPAGAGPPMRNGQGRRRIRPTDPINFIHNPPVIPILSATEANDQTAACIEWTYYRPAALGFTTNDTRLQWSKRSLADSGDVEFVGRNTGLIIYVRGTHEGEVLLECRMEGVVLASYRALVRRIIDIPCRVNILNGPVGARPRSTPQDVDNHIKVANIFLRQLGLRLVLDNDQTVTDNAELSGIPGIFRINNVNAGVTRNVTGNHPLCTRLNYRPGVLNIAYIHSDSLGGGFVGLGMASDFSGSRFGTHVEDNGTPSTSWIRPSGIPPDGSARNVRMRVFRDDWRRSGHPHLYGLYVTSVGNGNPSSEIGILTYAGTIAHEIGHILTLRHRIGAGPDGLNRPPGTNLMHGTNPSTSAQDLDIIQARAVLGCPLLQQATATTTTTTQPPHAGHGVGLPPP
ncbi:MAG: hypothetical protein QXQ02_08410 [Halobacteria archaeon]